MVVKTRSRRWTRKHDRQKGKHTFLHVLEKANQDTCTHKIAWLFLEKRAHSLQESPRGPHSANSDPKQIFDLLFGQPPQIPPRKTLRRTSQNKVQDNISSLHQGSTDTLLPIRFDFHQTLFQANLNPTQAQDTEGFQPVRARRFRRSASVIAPQIPCGSRVERALSRQIVDTSHSEQMAFARDSRRSRSSLRSGCVGGKNR